MITLKVNYRSRLAIKVDFDAGGSAYPKSWFAMAIMIAWMAPMKVLIAVSISVTKMNMEF